MTDKHVASLIVAGIMCLMVWGLGWTHSMPGISQALLAQQANAAIDQAR